MKFSENVQQYIRSLDTPYFSEKINKLDQQTQVRWMGVIKQGIIGSAMFALGFYTATRHMAERYSYDQNRCDQYLEQRLDQLRADLFPRTYQRQQWIQQQLQQQQQAPQPMPQAPQYPQGQQPGQQPGQQQAPLYPGQPQSPQQHQLPGQQGYLQQPGLQPPGPLDAIEDVIQDIYDAFNGELSPSQNP